MSEWLESEDGKSELLKFIDEMKSMSSKKSSQTNAMLAKSDNYSSDVANNSANDTTYDELVLFDQILAAEINKTPTDPVNSNIKERINQTSKIITEHSQRSEMQDWNTEPPKTAKIEENLIRPAEAEPKPRVFDAQRFIERIRRSPNGVNVSPNYELLSCKSQSFLQRLAVLGEMLT